MNQHLTIKDVGPIEQLAITVQTGGGVTVLKGANGSGKTTALRAAEALVRGEGKLETRDAAKASGYVNGFGAVLRLGRKATRAGEVEVSSLEGKLNIADLVAPPLKDPGAADRQRIKALVSLTGVEPTPELFKDVIGDAAEHVSAATWANKDLLDVASKAKRDLEAAARLKENEASMREGQAKACEESVRDVDLDAPDDEQALRTAHTDASSAYSVLKDRARAAVESHDRLEKARVGLRELQADYSGPNVEDAEAQLDERQGDVGRATKVVEDLRAQLRQAEADLSDCEHKRDRASDILEDATRYAATVEQYEAMLNESAAQAPDADDVAAAEDAITAASKAIEQGAVVRRAKAELAKGQDHRAAATAAAEASERLRQAAGQIDDVLSRAITGESLFVRDGRLYTTTEARGETLFGELSDGERWELAFDVAAPVVGERGVLVLPQDAWQHLDPVSRAHVAQLARERNVNVLTAEATDGELRAESYESEGNHAAD